MGAKKKAASVPSWPADKIERRKVKDLVPSARNARTHSEAQIAQLADLIEEYGWTTPVLIDEDDGVIAGHGRLLAAEMKHIDEVPVIVARGWSDNQKRAYAIADNKLGLNSEWDTDLLRTELAELADLGVDLELTGFSAEEIDSLLGGDDLVDIEPGSDGSRSGVGVENLSFGKYKVPLTTDELERLTAQLKDHVGTMGSQFGFIRKLLDAADAAP